jgi:hypothetical protein
VYVDRADGECDGVEVRIRDHSLYFRAHGLIPSSPTGGHPVNAEFNWWLLIVGLVLGAGLTWLVMAESTRRDADVVDVEQRNEARWIATTLTAAGRETDGDRVEEILRLHREYLGAPPPDEPAEVPGPAEPADLWPDPRPTAANVAAVPAARADEASTEDAEPSAGVRDVAPAETTRSDTLEAPAEDRA